MSEQEREILGDIHHSFFDLLDSQGGGQSEIRQSEGRQSEERESRGKTVGRKALRGKAVRGQTGL